MGGSVFAQAACGDPSALTSEQLEEARGIEALLRCPVCSGQSVLESNSEVAAEMKVKIREMLAACQTRQEILDYFVGEYGDWILNTPPARGAGLVAWIAPFVFLTAGGAMAWFFLRRWRGGPDGGYPARLTPEPSGGPAEGIAHADPEEVRRKIQERLQDYL